MNQINASKHVEFLGAECDQPLLREWYASLNESEVKASIRKTRIREFRPHDRDNFRLIVLCNHPFRALAKVIKEATEAGKSIAAS